MAINEPISGNAELDQDITGFGMGQGDNKAEVSLQTRGHVTEKLLSKSLAPINSQKQEKEKQALKHQRRVPG